MKPLGKYYAILPNKETEKIVNGVVIPIKNDNERVNYGKIIKTPKEIMTSYEDVIEGTIVSYRRGSEYEVEENNIKYHLVKCEDFLSIIE